MYEIRVCSVLRLAANGWLGTSTYVSTIPRCVDVIALDATVWDSFKADVVVQKQYVLPLFSVLDGVARLDRLSAALRNEQAYVLGSCHGRWYVWIPVCRHSHYWLARARQRILAERQMIRVAAMLRRIVPEIPQIDKLSVVCTIIGRLELAGPAVATAEKRLGCHPRANASKF